MASVQGKLECQHGVWPENLVPEFIGCARASQRAQFDKAVFDAQGQWLTVNDQRSLVSERGKHHGECPPRHPRGADSPHRVLTIPVAQHHRPHLKISLIEGHVEQDLSPVSFENACHGHVIYVRGARVVTCEVHVSVTALHRGGGSGNWSAF